MKSKNSKTVKEKSSPPTNIIAIDPSITCTGLCINGELTAITNESTAYTKTGKMKLWFDIVSQQASIKHIGDRETSKKYSEEEILKLKYYKDLKDAVIQIIEQDYFDPDKTLVVMEGFSYASAAGHLIDLVTFSTLIRNEILDKGFGLEIVSPSTLKLLTAKMSYEPTITYLNKKQTRSKKTWKNKKGVPGGNFKKPDMLKALLDSPHTDSEWKSFLIEHYSDLEYKTNVPKPIDDLNDAFLLYNIYKNGFDE